MEGTPKSLTARETSLAFQHAAKRGLDLLGALLGLLGLALLLPFLAAAIWLESPGGLIYRQERIGRGGKPFTLFKLRTMLRGCAEPAENELPGAENELFKRHQKLPAHPCYTRVGRWLSRASLDELPQLWNVLRGEMSLVGPRPCLPIQSELYGAHYAAYLSRRPGLTGLWQVSGRNNLPFEERARLDAEYAAAWSLALDLKILLRTIRVVLTQEGVW
jgi:lipopolysaccharide/colanic/teichoic acid biosynthesis glycosyltransferase